MKWEPLQHPRTLLVCLLLLLLPWSRADAAPLELSAVPLRDPDNRPATLAAYKGQVALLIYEDKDAGKQNQPFKDRLGAFVKEHGRRLHGRLRIIAVADVSKYDFWPARSFVQKALRKLRDDTKAEVLADWQGALRAPLGLPRGQSTVILLRPDGQVERVQRGSMPAAEMPVFLGKILELLPP